VLLESSILRKERTEALGAAPAAPRSSTQRAAQPATLARPATGRAPRPRRLRSRPRQGIRNFHEKRSVLLYLEQDPALKVVLLRAVRPTHGRSFGGKSKVAIRERSVPFPFPLSILLDKRRARTRAFQGCHEKQPRNQRHPFPFPLSACSRGTPHPRLLHDVRDG